MISALLDAVLPPACVACATVGSILCVDCAHQFTIPAAAEHPFVAPDPRVAVGEDLILALAAFTFEGALRRALHRLKYAGAARAAPAIALRALPWLNLVAAIAKMPVLVPVPASEDRRRQRGYDQAELLARALGSYARLPMARLLVRARTTTAQHRLDRAGRLRNLRDAFAVTGGAVPARVVLIDDILTTGATLEACARVLRHAGCAEVYAFAIAREV